MDLVMYWRNLFTYILYLFIYRSIYLSILFCCMSIMFWQRSCSLCSVYHSILQFFNLFINTKILSGLIYFHKKVFPLCLFTPPPPPPLPKLNYLQANFLLNSAYSSHEQNAAQAQKLHKMPCEIVTYSCSGVGGCEQDLLGDKVPGLDTASTMNENLENLNPLEH